MSKSVLPIKYTFVFLQLDLNIKLQQTSLNATSIVPEPKFPS